MLSPNTLIFPRPRYKNLQQKIAKIKVHQSQKSQDHIVYISKTKHKRRISHLYDLTSISPDQLAKRFSSYDLVMNNIQKGAQTHEFEMLRSNSNTQNIKNTVDKGIRRLKSNSCLNQSLKNQSKKVEFPKRKSTQLSENLTILSKVKLNEIYSQYTSVVTTARSQVCKQQSKLQTQRQSYASINITMDQIPCVYLQSQSIPRSNKLLVYYHANGEDLVNSFDFIKALSGYFYTNILVVEYPGYSLYSSSLQNNSSSNQLPNNSNCNDQQDIGQKIMSDVPFVLSYIKNIGYDLKNVIAVGRSIGTGPAIEIASMHEIGALILLSPFAKFSQVVETLYGKVASMIVKQPFENLTKSKQIKCPVLILHGLQDKTIHYSHSIQLSCQIRTFCCLKLVEQMTHNRFHYQSDIFQNIELFFEDIDMNLFE